MISNIISNHKYFLDIFFLVLKFTQTLVMMKKMMILRIMIGMRRTKKTEMENMK